MSWNGRREVIDERIIVTPGREIIEETITRGPYRERIEETIITGPRREIIEERVVIGGPRREVIEERVIVDRPGDSLYRHRRHEPPPPYSMIEPKPLPPKPCALPVLPVPKINIKANSFLPQIQVATNIIPGKVIHANVGLSGGSAGYQSGSTSRRSIQDSVYGWAPPSHCRGTLTWVQCFNGQVPSDAVHAGRDKDGSTIYAGRAFHNQDLLPAKVTPSHSCAYVSWGGNEIRKEDYEVLCSRHVAWQFDSQGRVPVEAIACGHTSSGERLYMGRCMHDGTMTVGKIQPSHHCCYIPYGGREISYREYEVLVLS